MSLPLASSFTIVALLLTRSFGSVSLSTQLHIDADSAAGHTGFHSENVTRGAKHALQNFWWGSNNHNKHYSISGGGGADAPPKWNPVTYGTTWRVPGDWQAHRQVHRPSFNLHLHSNSMNVSHTHTTCLYDIITKNSLMPALCSMLMTTYYAQNNAGIIHTPLAVKYFTSKHFYSKSEELLHMYM